MVLDLFKFVDAFENKDEKMKLPKTFKNDSLSKQYIEAKPVH